MAARRKKRSFGSVIFTLILVVLMAGAYLVLDNLGLIPDMTEETDTQADIIEKAPEVTEGEVLFHFIDVGQGDAILITSSDGNMLIDTSIKSQRDELDAYLKSAGIKTIDYLILTHPDSDHIGNADYIIENYDIKNILLPNCVSTTDTFERMLTAMENSDANVINPEPGYVFYLGALQNTVLAPLGEYKDVNDMSIVIKSVFGDTSVMLTGDAEKYSEADIVERWSIEALDSDILKVGHHGSETSTTDEFLAKVSPTIAVISCGEGNRYGHPRPALLDRLEAEGITVYRTDVDGTVVFKTDGNEFTLVE
jgi:competence protein ComEC